MSVRLYKKAYKLLVAEIAKAAAKDQLAGEISQKIALKRLKKLNCTKGKPVSESELQFLVGDLFPDFSPKVLNKAVRVNRPQSKLLLIPFSWMPRFFKK